MTVAVTNIRCTPYNTAEKVLRLSDNTTRRNFDLLLECLQAYSSSFIMKTSTSLQTSLQQDALKLKLRTI